MKRTGLSGAHGRPGSKRASPVKPPLAACMAPPPRPARRTSSWQLAAGCRCAAHALPRSPSPSHGRPRRGASCVAGAGAVACPASSARRWSVAAAVARGNFRHFPSPPSPPLPFWPRRRKDGAVLQARGSYARHHAALQRALMRRRPSGLGNEIGCWWR